MKLIDLFRRISLAALSISLLATASCTPVEETQEATISLSPSGHKINYFAQDVEVTVTSSEDWTMEGDFAWVVPSAASGKNGDKVVFSVNTNTTGQTRNASFTFKVNGAEAKFGIQQSAGEVEMALGLEAVSSGDTDVTLKVSVTSKDIAFFSKWGIVYSLTDKKDDGNEVKIDGVPAEGDKEVKVTGLEFNKKYYFWAFVEDVDGNRIYTDRAVEKNTGNLLDIPVVFSSGAFSIYASMDFQMTDIAELGICWSETEEPTVEDNTAYIENPTREKHTLCSITSGKKLKSNTKYNVRLYAKGNDGKVLYSLPGEVTTIGSPLDCWVNNDTPAENKFNSLCEYGPSWDGQSDHSQYVTEPASDAQTLIRNVWDKAFVSYSGFHYSYHSLMFREIDGKMYMYHQIYREGSINEGLPKEANFIGGLVYSMELDADNNMSFTFEGLQHMSTDNWVCDRQDVTKNEMYYLYNERATNKEDIERVKNFYEEHTFFVDYGPEDTYNNQPYRELRFYAADDISISFNYNQRIIGYRSYDFTVYATDDDGLGGGEEGGEEETGLQEPSAYTDMRHNSIAITWADPASVNNLSAITMEAMFRWDAFNTDEGIDTMFGVENSWLVRCMNNFHWVPEDGWFVCSPNGSICFAPFERDGSKNVTDWKGMTQDVWHHLAVTYDSATGNMTIYIDGQATMTGVYPLGKVNLYNPDLADPTFYIGKSYNDTRWFNGDMAEVRIWKKALSADEINAAGHFYGVDATSSDLLAYWKLDGTSKHVEDYSGNGNHGIMANGTEPEPEPDVLPKDNDGYYLLASAADWESFANIVKANNSANARFTADINIGTSQTMLAYSDEYPTSVDGAFNGTIDGDGYTLTIAYVMDDSRGETTMAPIFYAGNTTIKNLHVAGTLTTSRERSCGFIGFLVGGTANIENCVSSVEIIQNHYDWCDTGGFVGRTDAGSTLFIKDCVFNGKFTCSTDAYEWGPFLGWGRGGSSITLENCLVDPVLNIQNTQDSHTFANTAGDAYLSLTNCWYTKTVGSAQGEDGSGLSAAELVSKLNNGRADGPWKVKDGKATTL